MDNPLGFVEVIQTGGLVGALALFLYGFYKRWWVQGSLYDEKIRDCAAKDAEIRELQSAYRAEILPALIDVLTLFREQAQEAPGERRRR